MRSIVQSLRPVLVLGALAGSALYGQATGPYFGSAVQIGTTPSDIVVDESRTRLYLVNSAANRVDIYDYAAGQITGSFGVGTFPISASMTMDGSVLFVTNRDSSSLSVVDLSTGGVRETVALPAKPEGVAVGSDGRVLITTQGTGTNNALNTLLLYDRAQASGQQVQPLPTPQSISAPSTNTGRPQVAFSGRMDRTPDGQYIIGMTAINQTANNAQSTLFVYETSSGVVLRSRIVTGQSSVLSISPDGSRFMAGSTLYDTATLAVIAQMSTANLPFYIQTSNNGATGTNPAFNVAFNYGGSTFSPDGTTVYGAFNTSANTARPVANILYVSSPDHLGVRLGIRLPQSILGRMMATSDGSTIFAASEAGLLVLPIANLYDYPLLQPETTQVFLAVDNCNKGLAQAQVKVTNPGKGRATFSLPNVTAALVSQVDTGLAPSTITFTMEPGRSGVVRQPGTNLFTGAGSGTGTPIDIILSSNEAINLPNTIRVYMNYRQPDQAGIVYARPVALNNTQGLQELLLDEQRQRLYLTNAGYNRLEVFDTSRKQFLPPVDVGQLPKSMAMSLDGSTLYVGNTGGESITTVDLDSLTVTGKVDFPPVPRAGNQTPVQPSALAVSLSGLQFAMSNGSLWHVVGNQATQRATGSVVTGNLSAPQYMIGTRGGERVVAIAGNGVGYLYDGLADAFTLSRQIYDQTPQSYFAPLAAAPAGEYFVVSGLILNPGLAVIGGTERPSSTTITFPTQPGQPPSQTTVSVGARNVAAAYSLDENRFVRLTTPVRQNTTSATQDDVRPLFELVDTRTLSKTVVAVAPENPVQSVFGATRVNVPAKQMAVDSKGTAYTITLSGLSVVDLSMSGATVRPAIPTGTRGIVNSTDGTATFRPGSFITITGTNLASEAKADTLPPPTVLGGSCVTFNDVAVPLLETAPGRISAMIPASVRTGQNVLQIRSLATAQSSDPLLVTVQKPQQ